MSKNQISRKRKCPIRLYGKLKDALSNSDGIEKQKLDIVSGKQSRPTFYFCIILPKSVPDPWHGFFLSEILAETSSAHRKTLTAQVSLGSGENNF